ncbi:hypothetical protein ACF09H_27175 [Streptomyces sp. NPDC014983]|uniref:oxidoreductase n=1 Tax=Streptomyces sp. NPDC014983 TaxID=3364933 RepID=UPI0036F8799E
MPTHVFREGTLGGLRLANRIVMGAMHLNLETRADDGAAMAAFYAERARGGAGLIVTGGCAVAPEGSGGRHYAGSTTPPATVPSRPGRRPSTGRADGSRCGSSTPAAGPRGPRPVARRSRRRAAAPGR